MLPLLVFWTAIALVLYGYVGYPLLLLLLALGRRRPTAAAPITPRVTLIVSARNAALAIGEKIANCLQLDYPEDHLEILVASDGSTDGTNELVRQVRDPRVRLVAVDEHRGKEVAQREAIARATGEILVFTDVGVRLPPAALRALVAHFADPTVGCVSGVDRVISPTGEVLGESAFVRYETLLKRLESRLGSTAGNSGWFFAVRRSLCDDWPQDMASDFTMLLRTVRHGLRGVVEPRAVGYAVATPSGAIEFRRKVRTIVRGMVVLAAHTDLLNPFRYGLFSLQLWSHKVFRWSLPFLLVTILATNLVLLPQSATYQALLIGQLIFYALAALLPTANIPRFLVSSSAAAVVAWWKFLAGEKFVVWDPTPRSQALHR